MNLKSLLSIVVLCLSVGCFSQNYILENTGIPQNKKDSILLHRMIEHEMSFYEKIFTVDSIRIKLRIIDNESVYYLYQKNIRKSNDRTSLGFFSTKTKEAVILKTKRINYLTLAYHEFSLCFMFNGISKPPLWLNEGVAEYFEHVDITKKEIRHEMSDYEIARIKTMIQIRDIDLSDFLSWTTKEFMLKQKTNDNYAYMLSHGIVYFLINKDFEQFKQLVLKIKNGSSSKEAFDASYSGGFKQFETDFTTYYTNYEQ